MGVPVVQLANVRRHDRRLQCCYPGTSNRKDIVILQEDCRTAAGALDDDFPDLFNSRSGQSHHFLQCQRSILPYLGMMNGSPHVVDMVALAIVSQVVEDERRAVIRRQPGTMLDPDRLANPARLQATFNVPGWCRRLPSRR
jgi:hypothetical protein